MSEMNVLHQEYNSTKKDITLPEYGRIIQEMIRHCKTLPDKEIRTSHLMAVVELIQQMNPHSRNVENYKEKIWNHVYEIANYDLDINLPEGIVIAKKIERKKPEILPYPKTETKLRHYGNNVMRMINKALVVEDPEKREIYTHIIGAYMKLAFRTWNKEHFVTDEVIKSDIKTLSGGRLTLEEDAVIETIRPINAPRRISTLNPERSRNGKRNNYGGKRNNTNNNSNRPKWRNNRPN